MAFYQRNFPHLRRRLELIYIAPEIEKEGHASQVPFQTEKLNFTKVYASHSSHAEGGDLEDPHVCLHLDTLHSCQVDNSRWVCLKTSLPRVWSRSHLEVISVSKGDYSPLKLP